MVVQLHDDGNLPIGTGRWWWWGGNDGRNCDFDGLAANDFSISDDIKRATKHLGRTGTGYITKPGNVKANLIVLVSAEWAITDGRCDRLHKRCGGATGYQTDVPDYCDLCCQFSHDRVDNRIDTHTLDQLATRRFGDSCPLSRCATWLSAFRSKRAGGAFGLVVESGWGPIVGFHAQCQDFDLLGD